MPMLTASSYNKTLWSAVGAAIGTELRGFANTNHSGLTVWTPNLNINRDPRWGRILRDKGVSGNTRE